MLQQPRPPVPFDQAVSDLGQWVRPYSASPIAFGACLIPKVVRQVAAMVKSLREEYDFPIFLNADHTHSLPSALEAAKAGFDWIVFDVSTLSWRAYGPRNLMKIT